ncbi:MAG TPA: ATP-binding protein [Armatimonadota bacterium]|jgi:SpoVK/Ycf46/Vps4 family AAA+-type ATPase
MLRELLQWGAKRGVLEAMNPSRTFEDVILPAATRRALDQALVQIEKSELIFSQWGLGQRHSTGTGLAFNFAGPPGTGKSICAEAVASALGKRMLKVRYSELESQWAGETGKNVAFVFREAKLQDAVLFFDEADTIAARRFTGMGQGYEREANTVVNTLLKELEEYRGVVVFATNLAANFDPAFERRIRSHILFEMPGARERELIWKVQLHPTRTPLSADVDFRDLAARFEVSGGDIKNAVLKAAQIAAGEPGLDEEKRLTQQHFLQGMEDVLASKTVMEQSVFEGKDDLTSLLPFAGANTEKLDELTASHQELRERSIQEGARLELLSQQTLDLRAQLARQARTLMAVCLASGAVALVALGLALAEVLKGSLGR